MVYGELRTKLVTGGCSDDERSIYQAKRQKMIEEAVSWPLGYYEPETKIIHPQIYPIAVLPNDMKVFFEKPGIEIFFDPPNMNDLKPVVGDPGQTLSFSEMWSYLARVASVDIDAFRAIMALIYRVCYLKDHVEAMCSFRYRPSEQVSKVIDELDEKVGYLFTYRNTNNDRFGLWGMLHMIDVVGWQEDVKYHGPGRVKMNGRKKGQPFEVSAGRENNILSCINITFRAAMLVNDIELNIELAKSGKEPNFRTIFDAMQGLMAAKGVSPCTQTNLIQWLEGYILTSDEPAGRTHQVTLGIIDKGS